MKTYKAIKMINVDKEDFNALISRICILENQMADLLRQDETDVCLTNEEAIEILKSKMDGSVDTSYEWVEAIRIAIGAIKSNDKIAELLEELIPENDPKKGKLVGINEYLKALNSRVNILESQMSDLLRQTSDKKKNMEILEICEKCNSQSYSNGFDAGYELGKEDAQNSSLDDEVETVKTNERFDKLHLGYVDGYRDGYADGHKDGYEKGKSHNKE